jgi:Tfp pilus assembly protein PilF
VKIWTAAQKNDYVSRCSYIEADAYQARGDWLGVKTSFETLLAMSPTDGRLCQRAGRALIACGKPDEACPFMFTASHHSPELGSGEFCMATALAAHGNVAMACEWFGKAIQAQPDSFQVHLAFAQWLVKQKDLAGAKVHAEKAAKIRPKEPELLRLQMQIADAEKPSKFEPSTPP